MVVVVGDVWYAGRCRELGGFGIGLDVVDCLGVFLGVGDVLRVFSVCM